MSEKIRVEERLRLFMQFKDHNKVSHLGSSCLEILLNNSVKTLANGDKLALLSEIASFCLV